VSRILQTGAVDRASLTAAVTGRLIALDTLTGEHCARRTGGRSDQPSCTAGRYRSGTRSVRVSTAYCRRESTIGSLTPAQRLPQMTPVRRFGATATRCCSVPRRATELKLKALIDRTRQMEITVRPSYAIFTTPPQTHGAHLP